ncbi:hypothetical protein AMV090 [Betaentomopoxvirus amoorei]|uniref:AMV090 n=1 Tax=Amsacta moorei entomopoxvirus TaxID=28321 RepID=Q9EMV9_AMEPV|nr:hypothetical protein AMV090 [Amsacta moorei entomopoxvirus]AAG02796.1 AMV090 [Amsacta moorei entomopoxvirus]
MDLIEYDNNHYIEPIANRKDIYLNFVTAPLVQDIDCSLIKHEDNIYDVTKYFVFKTYNYEDIYIVYDVLLNKVVLFKFNFTIKEYIIINNFLIIIYNDNDNIIIDIEDKKYIKFKKWKSLLLNCTQIANYIKLIEDENKKIFVKYITKNDILIDNNTIDNNKIKKYNKIKCINIENKVTLSILDNNNELYINNKLFKLDYNIYNIFNFSLKHVLLLTDIDDGNIIILNLENLEQDEYKNYYDIIVMINDKFYNNIRNAFLVND